MTRVTAVSIFVLALVSISGVVKGDSATGSALAQSAVDSLSIKLTNYEIGRVEILQIPPDILTRTIITPALLESTYNYKFTIRDVRSGPYREELIKVVESTKVQPQSEPADLRWGVIFYGLDESRIGAVYFDKWGNAGEVNSVTVSYKGKMFKWLVSRFSQTFR